MTKKHFIALAEAIATSDVYFTDEQLSVLAKFCKEQNPQFNAVRWIGYIRGENGPSGGKV